jgi:mono/diheme cytochrome c family protein
MQARFLIASVLLPLGMACSRPTNDAPAAKTSDPSPPATPAAAPAPLSGAEVFKTRCVVCHGDSGKGDGPGAAALTVKPRNYTDAAWQKSVTDEQLRAIIVQGGAAVGKDPGMPPNPDLASNAAAVDELVKLIRGFAAPG